VIKPTVATGAGDSITDFTSGSDRLVLKKIDFTALASTVGTGFSTATDFVTIAGGVATAATDRIIFDSTNKIVYYDSDGSGSTAAVAIVTLVGQTVAASDFVITA
jgi:enhancing lycopene biosynthesis protein 2